MWSKLLLAHIKDEAAKMKAVDTSPFLSSFLHNTSADEAPPSAPDTEVCARIAKNHSHDKEDVHLFAGSGTRKSAKGVWPAEAGRQGVMPRSSFLFFLVLCVRWLFDAPQFFVLLRHAHYVLPIHRNICFLGVSAAFLVQLSLNDQQ